MRIEVWPTWIAGTRTNTLCIYEIDSDCDRVIVEASDEREHVRGVKDGVLIYGRLIERREGIVPQG